MTSPLPPRVLQVGLFDLVGQRFNGYGLHRAMRERGRDSRMLVVHRHSSDSAVHAHTRVGGWIERGLYAAERVASLPGFLSPMGLQMPLRSCFRKADVVHWHLIYPHFIGLPFMAPLARWRPTVWTLHDLWAMTGHCVHPMECERWKTGCGHCPDLGRNFEVWFDTTAFIWRARKRTYRRAPLTLVVASRWMKERVEESPLLSHLPCHVIPFGLDLATWRPQDRLACRQRLGIPPEAKVVAFRMKGGARHRGPKGIPWLVEALGRLTPGTATHLLVLDDRGRLTELQDRYRIVEVGWVEDEQRVAEVLSAADVFVMPSLAESFGMMALEAMACGTAVIISAGTAMTEHVRPPRAGLAVPQRDADALARALTELLGDDARRAAMGSAGRAVVEAEYTAAAYVDAHLRLYDALAAGGPAGTR